MKSHNVEHALLMQTLLRNAPHPVEHIFQLCGRSSLSVLGSTNPVQRPCSFDPVHLSVYTDSSSQFPRVFCPNESMVAVQIIIFNRPSPTRMQYMSLDPISLSLSVDSSNKTAFPYSFDANEDNEASSRDRESTLINKLRMHTVIRRLPTQRETMIPLILNQINCSLELAQLLSKNVHLIGPRPKRSLSMSERVVESATTFWGYIIFGLWHVLAEWIYPLLTRAFVIGLICHRVVAELVLVVLEWRPHPESAALKDISATAQQVDIRLQQFCYWPIQYTALRKRKNDWESITQRHPDYIRFYNSLWLVANDVIIGIALGSYIIDNADWVVFQINRMSSGWTVEGLRRTINWLMDWPAGLKLNTELAIFLGDLFLWVISCWSSMSEHTRIQ